jgi:hypothetical protein
MPQRLEVIDPQRHHRHLQASAGKLGVFQTHTGQSLDSSLLKPGHINAMPHNTGMVGVLG